MITEVDELPAGVIGFEAGGKIGVTDTGWMSHATNLQWVTG